MLAELANRAATREGLQEWMENLREKNKQNIYHTDPYAPEPTGERFW